MQLLEWTGAVIDRGKICCLRVPLKLPTPFRATAWGNRNLGKCRVGCAAIAASCEWDRVDCFRFR